MGNPGRKGRKREQQIKSNKEGEPLLIVLFLGNMETRKCNFHFKSMIKKVYQFTVNPGVLANKTHAAHLQHVALCLCDAGGPGSRQSWPISLKQDMFIKVPIKTQELWQGSASWNWAFWRSLFHLGAGVGCNKPCISSAEEKEMFWWRARRDISI